MKFAQVNATARVVSVLSTSFQGRANLGPVMALLDGVLS